MSANSVTDRADQGDWQDAQLAVATRGLTCYYGRRVGVRSLDLRIAAGQIFGFLGPNGAGKTTTIRLLLGFLRPSAGRATVFGHDCWRRRTLVQREVGYVPGDLRLYPWLTAERALRICGQIRGMDLTAAGRELSGQLRLEMDLRARKMSRGMRQKLGLLLALVHRPRLLVLDEPTSGLDPLMQDVLMDLLRARAAEGTTVFFSSHTLSEVEQLCDHIAIVRDGMVVVDDALDAWRRKAGREITLLFASDEAAREAAVPDFLTLDSRAGRRWHGELTGPPATLIRWAAGQSLEDLEIGPPSLENLFRTYYRVPEERS